MSPCENCNNYHAADEDCPNWRCPRCDEHMDGPEQAEGCRDFDCPAHP